MKESIAYISDKRYDLRLYEVRSQLGRFYIAVQCHALRSKGKDENYMSYRPLASLTTPIRPRPPPGWRSRWDFRRIRPTRRLMSWIIPSQRTCRSWRRSWIYRTPSARSWWRSAPSSAMAWWSSSSAKSGGCGDAPTITSFHWRRLISWSDCSRSHSRSSRASAYRRICTPVYSPSRSSWSSAPSAFSAWWRCPSIVTGRYYIPWDTRAQCALKLP